MQVTFRPGRVDDAKACGAICYEAFKAIAEPHNFPPDFPSSDIAVGLLTMVLSRTDVYAVVAECERQVVGSNFLWEGDTIAGVGPIDYGPAYVAERLYRAPTNGARFGSGSCATMCRGAAGPSGLS